MDTCEICDRQKVSGSDWALYTEGEGSHLCWGSSDCLARAVNWRDEALKLRKRCTKLESSLRIATNALDATRAQRAQQAETLRLKVEKARGEDDKAVGDPCTLNQIPGLQQIAEGFDKVKKLSSFESELATHRELLLLIGAILCDHTNILYEEDDARIGSLLNKLRTFSS